MRPCCWKYSRAERLSSDFSLSLMTYILKGVAGNVKVFLVTSCIFLLTAMLKGLMIDDMKDTTKATDQRVATKRTYCARIFTSAMILHDCTGGSACKGDCKAQAKS